MTCRIVRTKGAVFALWGKPAAPDMDRVLSELRAAAEESQGPVIYVTRVPSDAPPPDPEVRQHLVALLPVFLGRCSSYHVILEGTGFFAALKRGVLTNIIQPFWKKRVFFFVHASASQVLDKVRDEEHRDAARVLQMAQTRGYLSCPAPEAAQGQQQYNAV